MLCYVSQIFKTMEMHAFLFYPLEIVSPLSQSLVYAYNLFNDILEWLFRVHQAYSVYS